MGIPLYVKKSSYIYFMKLYRLSLFLYIYYLLRQQEVARLPCSVICCFAHPDLRSLTAHLPTPSIPPPPCRLYLTLLYPSHAPHAHLTVIGFTIDRRNDGRPRLHAHVAATVVVASHHPHLLPSLHHRLHHSWRG
jgi:hypothetical protein